MYSVFCWGLWFTWTLVLCRLIKYASVWIILYADIQLNQDHLVNILSFFPLYDFAFFVKNQVSIGVWVYFWVFSLIPLINQSVFISMPWRFFVLFCFVLFCFVLFSPQLLCNIAWGQGWWFFQKFLYVTDQYCFVYPAFICLTIWSWKLFIQGL